MPKNTLYSLVTMSDSRNNGFEKVEIMGMFGTQLQSAAIHPHISNAMAAVLGHDTSRMWRLWEVAKSESCSTPPQSAPYKADEQTRYFFAYGMASPTSSGVTGDHPIAVMEYSRMDRFEIRASYLLDTGFQSMKVSGDYAREALTALLFAIMCHEKNNSDYIALATNFKKEYAAKFSKGPQSALSLIEAIHNTLLEVIDPLKKSTAIASFEAAPVLLNASDGYFKPVLLSEGIGCLSNETTIHLAAKTLTTKPE